MIKGALAGINVLGNTNLSKQNDRAHLSTHEKLWDGKFLSNIKSKIKNSLLACSIVRSRLVAI